MSGIVILVMSVLAIAIVYPIIGGVSISTIDTSLQTQLSKGTGFTPTSNATQTVLSGTNIVMGINPLAALVAVAAGILLLLMGVFSPGVKQANI